MPHPDLPQKGRPSLRSPCLLENCTDLNIGLRQKVFTDYNDCTSIWYCADAKPSLWKGLGGLPISTHPFFDHHCILFSISAGLSVCFLAMIISLGVFLIS